MSELILPRKQVLVPGLWHPGAAAELLLPTHEDALRDFLGFNREKARRFRKAFEILLMAGSKGNYLEDKVSAEVLGATAFSAPGTVYFGLWISGFGDAAHGGTATETTYGSYDRVSKTNNTTNFAGTTSPRVNSTAITFPTSTSGSQTVTQVGCLDGNAKTSADNNLVWADLTASRTIDVAETPEFAASAFSYSED